MDKFRGEKKEKEEETVQKQEVNKLRLGDLIIDFKTLLNIIRRKLLC